MRKANRNPGAHARHSSSWSLIAGALVLGLLLAAVGYSFGPNYVNTATNTHATAPAATTGSMPPPAEHP
jgi:hypothetical protein